MKKNILKYFYVYLLVFLLFGFIYSAVTAIFLNNKIENEIKNVEKLVIKNIKKRIKIDLENIKNIFGLIKNMIYEINNEELLKFIKIPIKWNIDKLYVSNDFIYGLVNKKLNYSVTQNYIFVILNNKKYLSVLQNNGKKVYIFGINKKFLDDIIIFNFLKYIDQYNKNKISYVAIGKVTNLNAKNGIFGYVYHMPDRFKNLEGNILSTKKPDAKGNYYRAKYFKCFQKNRPCFVKYYFKNPKTGKIEEKISYFTFLKDYNFILGKGIYASQIKADLNKEIHFRVNKLKDLIYNFLGLFLIIYLIFLGILYILLSKIRNILLKDYEKLEKELIHRLYYDKLTKLPNRNKLLEDIKKFNSLILIDIEDFSDINDVFGFEIGDKILIEFSKCLKNYFKTSVYRIGSDEFAIASKTNFVETTIKNFINKKRKFYEINLDFTMGVSNYKKRLLETAEMSLKFAFKEKKKYIIYDENIYKKQKEKLSKINMLKEVLKNQNIFPYYQCIVDKYGNTIKYEALMRIKIGDSIYSPFYFMDLIKEARLYVPFSKIMLKKVFEDLKYFDKKVSINLSFEDIANKDMKSYILQLIDDNNEGKVVFEILESESVKNYDILKDFINQVKNKNIEIAIDDFGSGYSNFVNIMKLNPDIIKIDASLIKEMNEERNMKLIELIVTFAKEFGLKTVAEFVSDKDKFEKLKTFSVDEYQGFYFCEPKPLENIIKKDKISSKKGNNEE